MIFSSGMRDISQTDRISMLSVFLKVAESNASQQAVEG
jgi:hypothetical protein